MLDIPAAAFEIFWMTVFRHNLRVTYVHCTLGNHVYYARYLDMLEAARGEFFRQIGSSCLQLQQADTIFPVIGVQLAYKAPARYDDLLTIELCLTQLSGIRLNFGCRILNEQGTVLVEGETRHVCTTPSEKPKRLPLELAGRLQPYVSAPADA